MQHILNVIFLGHFENSVSRLLKSLTTSYAKKTHVMLEFFRKSCETGFITLLLLPVVWLPRSEK